jgi:hypothetical protein
MPYSEKQQISARIALAAKRRGTSKGLKGSALSMHKSMSTNQLQDFAKGPILKRRLMSAR